MVETLTGLNVKDLLSAIPGLEGQVKQIQAALPAATEVVAVEAPAPAVAEAKE